MLLEATRKRAFSLVARAYSCISVEDLCAFVGMAASDAIDGLYVFCVCTMYTCLNSTQVSMPLTFSGCLQLLEILEIYWNLKTLLEISWNLIGPPGNFCVRCQRSTALVSSHKNMDKYSSQKYEMYHHQMCSFKFQMH